MQLRPMRIKNNIINKLLAEVVQNAFARQGKSFSIIGDVDVWSPTAPENRITAKTEGMEEALGIEKDSKVYSLVKKFAVTLKKRIKNIKMKKNVIQEMVETEKTYIKGLAKLIAWRDEILDKKFTKSSNIEILFSTVIDNIKLISDQILIEITKAFENWEKDSVIGDIFLKFAPFLKQYKDYCKNNEKSGKMLVELMKNKDFNQYVIDQEKGGNTFQSHLILPIQRIPRYEMLLGAAKKYTNKDQRDYKLLGDACDLVHEICDANNKEIGLFLGQKRKIELNEVYGSHINLMLPQRNLVEEFPNLYMIDVETDKPQEWSLILFTDCIIVLTHIKKIRQAVYFGHTVFNETSFIYSKNDMKNYKNLFKIVGKTKWFIIGAATEAERDRVVAEVSKYIFTVRK